MKLPPGVAAEALTALQEEANFRGRKNGLEYTMPAPELWSPAGYVLYPRHTTGGYSAEGVGYWYWVIAGRTVVSVFAVGFKDDIESLKLKAVTARARLVEFVRLGLPESPRNVRPKGVGVVQDGGEMPEPVRESEPVLEPQEKPA